MKSTKERIRELLDELPDDVSFDRVILEIRQRADIELGFDQLRRGEGIGHHEVKERLRAWRASYGRPEPNSG